MYPWPAIFRKSKDWFSFITVDLKKPKKIGQRTLAPKALVLILILPQN